LADIFKIDLDNAFAGTVYVSRMLANIFSHLYSVRVLESDSLP